MDTIIWDEKKIKSYFDECTTRYEHYYDRITDLEHAFTNFVNDDSHTGEEADSARLYVQEVQIPMLNEMARAIRLLQTKQDSLIRDYDGEVDTAADTIDEDMKLGEIVKDFSSYLSQFKSTAANIEKYAKLLNSSCTLGGLFLFTVPSSTAAEQSFEKMSDESGTRGLVPKHKKTFVNFDDTHKTDVDSNSEFGILIDMIRKNIKRITAAAEGSDMESVIKGYSHNTTLREQIIKPEDVLDEQQLKDFQEYVDKLGKYLRGEGTRCSVFGSDPVNMTEGNYVGHKTDIEIGGMYPLEFTRYYNAMSEHTGIFGRGWTHTFDRRLIFEDKEDGRKTINALRADGSERMYILDKDGNISDELHGEQGVLKKVGSNYVITFFDGKKEKYDKNGWLKEIAAPSGGGVKIKRDSENPEQVIQAKNLYGAELVFSYEDGKMTSVQDHTGRKVTYEYVEGRLSAVHELSGSIRHISYDEMGRINELGRDDRRAVLRNKYGEDGRIIKQSYADGSFVTFEYDDKNNVTIYREQNGNVVRYLKDESRRHTATETLDGTEYFGYDDRNNRVSYTDRRGFTTRYTYDKWGHMTSKTNPLGEKTSATYDSNGHLFSLKTADGRRWKMIYDKSGKLLEKRDPMNNVTRWEYSPIGECTRIIYADGTDKKMSYSKGNCVSVTLQNGETEYYEYDDLNRMIRKTDVNGNIIEMSYDDNDRIISETDQRGCTTRMFYDNAGHLTEKTYPDGTEEKWEYDEMGRLVKKTERDGSSTENTYDIMGQIVLTRSSDGKTVRYERDLFSRVTEMVSSEDGSSRYEYDENGNQTSIIKGWKRVTQRFDALNRMTETEDSAGNLVKIVYDTAGNVIEKRKNDVAFLKFEYDDNGNKTMSWKLGKGTEKWEYDCMNRVTSWYREGYGTLTYEYDAMGHVCRKTDEDGNSTGYVMDTAGNIMEMTDALQNRTRYSYDPCGDLIEVMRSGDGVDQVTRYERDILGRVTGVIDAEGNRTEYVLDAAGRITEETDNKGQVTRYNYGEHSLPDSIIYADSKEVHFGYNEDNRLSSISDWNGETLLNYDIKGKIDISYPNGERAGLEFNGSGRKKTVHYPDGSDAVYEYDHMKRLKKIEAGEQEISYSYDDNGRLCKKSGNDGFRTYYLYDSIGRLSKITHADNEGTLDVFSYAYDSRGNCCEVIKERRDDREESGVYRYEYDALNRLDLVKKDDEVLRKYEYDPFGNRTKMTEFYRDGSERNVGYSYNLLNQLVLRNGDDGKEEYSYDANGNLEAVFKNGEEIRRMSYDAANMLKCEQSGGKEYHYEYNGIRQLVGCSSDNEKTEYIPDIISNSAHPLMKKEDSKTFSFIWDGGELISEIVSGDETEVLRAVTDRNGSIVREINENGETVSKTSYDEFGNEVTEREAGRRGTFGYAGYLRSSTGEMLLAGVRQYMPSAARFTAKDPVAGCTVNPGSQNQYVYCFNSPLNWIDPTGRTPDSIVSSFTSILPDKEDLEEFGKNFMDEVEKVEKQVSDFTESIPEKAEQLWEDGKQAVEQAGKDLCEDLQNAGKEISEKAAEFNKQVTEFVDNIPEMFDQTVEDGKELLDKAEKAAAEGLKEAGEAITQKAAEFEKAVSDFIDNMPEMFDQAVEDGKNLISKIQKATEEWLKEAGEVITQKAAEFKNAVVDFMDSLPERLDNLYKDCCDVFNKAEKAVVQGLKDAGDFLSKKAAEFKDWAVDFAESIPEKLDNAWKQCETVFSDIGKKISDGFKQFADECAKEWNAFVKEAKGAWESLTSWFNDTKEYISKAVCGRTEVLYKQEIGDSGSLEITAAVQGSNTLVKKIAKDGTVTYMLTSVVTNPMDPSQSVKTVVSWSEDDPESLKVTMICQKKVGDITYGMGIECSSSGNRYIVTESGKIASIPDELKPGIPIDAGANWCVTYAYGEDPGNPMYELVGSTEMQAMALQAVFVYNTVHGAMTMSLPKDWKLPSIDPSMYSNKNWNYVMMIAMVAVIIICAYMMMGAGACAAAA